MQGSDGTWHFDGGRLRVDAQRREVRLHGRRLDLTGRRFDLLLALLQRRDRVAGKDELLQAVWPGRVVQDNNLEVHVAALRSAIGREAIVTVRGRGYRWVLPPDPAHGHRAPADGHPAAADGLPVPAGGALIGRGPWLQAAAPWCQPAAVPRVVTLHGAGGVGKTRLALALAAQHGAAYADGACTVRLAPVRQLSQLAHAVAAALGLQPLGAQPIEAQLEAYLGERELLLVLDNAEHLLPELAPLLQRWCDVAPRLRMLLTSRLPLGLSGEQRLPVPPLALPDMAHGDAPALELLLTHARALGQDITQPADERAAAAEICRRLDGLPLALELAAARLRVMSPRALLARLSKPLALLSGGAAEDPRHRSLADTLAYSLDLLPAAAQALFARLGVFVDGCTPEAVQQVGATAAGPALDALDALLELGLLRRIDAADGEPRYTLLEPVREFALQRLAAEGGVDEACARHADWFQGLAERLAPQLRSARRAQALLALRADRANLAAALRWRLHQRPDAAAALRLAASLTWAWYFGGSLLEGRQWLHEALALDERRPASKPSAERVAALVGASHLSMYLFDLADAAARAQEALQGARALADARLQAEALFVCAVPMLAYDPAAALPLWQQAIQAYAACGDAWGLALATSCLGIPMAMSAGQEAQAEALLGEGRRLFAELDDDWGINLHDHYMGLIALRRGDCDRARDLFGRSLETAQALDDGLRVGGALHQLANVERRAGQRPLSLQRLQQAAAVHHAQGRSGYTGMLLRQGAGWCAEQGEDLRAARLFGAASVERGLVLPVWSTPEEAQAAAAAEAALRGRMASADFERAWHEGRSWTLAQAVAALSDA